MKQDRNYSPRHFYESMPRWKRIKDPPLSRIFYRPVSYLCASACAKCGIGANTVSYLSTLVAIATCALFIPAARWCNITAAVLCNVWLIMDCTDGNLARGVKRQAFGAFADSMSSYILVGFIVTAMGYCAYVHGGLLLKAGTPWIILLGALASTSDTMMRLIHKKYKACERSLQDDGVLKAELDVWADTEQSGSWRVRLESDWGIGGFLPLLILLGTIFNALDIVVLYCLVYFGGSFLVITLGLVRKAVRAQNKYTLD